MLKNKQWDQNMIECLICENEIWNEWPEFQIYYKTQGQIFIYKANEPDYPGFKEEWNQTKKQLI